MMSVLQFLIQISFGLSIFSSISEAGAFVPSSNPTFTSTFRIVPRPVPSQHQGAVALQSSLFEDDPEMLQVAENYIHAKYQQVIEANGHDVATSSDVTSVLRTILPPVTADELAREEDAILKELLSHDQNTKDSIDEDDFVSSMVKNSYWQEAGDIVVKELMYFDSLHSYYKTGKALLNNDDYDELHENLTWEGSSVATMSAKEAEFVSAVAASKRGEPYMNDAEYSELKQTLKDEGSWVVNRGADALEKLNLDTFMGYLHRSL